METLIRLQLIVNAFLKFGNSPRQVVFIPSAYPESRRPLTTPPAPRKESKYPLFFLSNNVVLVNADHRDVRNRVVAVDFDEAYTLRRPSHYPQRIH